ncbi:hypothetical protein BD779DRAFT_1509791 [Infundibulicybe gibba]|nr:hypothetical protein BD779DRAFT_1509791 [Infundibulicybe gibba]
MDRPRFKPPRLLHPDDASSKVFLAIARAFLSVDNRAMTIKDLAEMAVAFGLVCQNLSAASQAITTYIRTHMARCDLQQDHPLLLRHTLSGTPDDDDLLPALHSRSGGAHCATHPDNRATNFRRGTVVWYLSRATGAPCPFSRAGIRLCDYTEAGRALANDRRQHPPDTACGQKRKRILRGSAQNPDEGSDDDDKPHPPKVKLTFRLKPLFSRPSPSPSPPPRQVIDISSDSDQDSMSVDSSSSEESSDSDDDDEPESTQHMWGSSQPDCRHSEEDECDDYSQVMASADDAFYVDLEQEEEEAYGGDEDDDDDDEDASEEGDPDSPGPRSPSAPATCYSGYEVKEEPRDIQGVLDAWEDFDSFLVGVGAHALKQDGEIRPRVKEEEIDTDLWEWEKSLRIDGRAGDWNAYSLPYDPLDLSGVRIKQEEQDDGVVLRAESEPCSSEPEDKIQMERTETLRPKRRTVAPVPVSSSSSSSKSPPPPFTFTLRPPAIHTHSTPPPPTSPSGLVALVQGLSMDSPVGVAPSELLLQSTARACATSAHQSACISPLDTQCPRGSRSERRDTAQSVVVYTCQPCEPSISATQVDGISVYQMTLRGHTLLRRIDTDFVNLSAVQLCMTPNAGTNTHLPGAVTVPYGAPPVRGVWVPLSVARAAVRLDTPGAAALETFLAETLFERFPSALKDFHRTSVDGRLLGQFGAPFAAGEGAIGVGIGAGQVLGWMQEGQGESETLVPEAWAGEHEGKRSEGEAQGQDVPPLSATEEEMFRTLCDIPEWNTASVSVEMEVEATAGEAGPSHAEKTEADQQPMALRRSKRVADAIAARTGTTVRTRKRGSRNSS